MLTLYSYLFPDRARLSDWRELEDKMRVFEPKGIPFSATSLGDAIQKIELLLKVRIVPHDEGKYFRVYRSDLPEEYTLSDIHVRRAGKELCPKHDLAFALIDGDAVLIREPIC